MILFLRVLLYKNLYLKIISCKCPPWLHLQRPYVSSHFLSLFSTFAAASYVLRIVHKLLIVKSLLICQPRQVTSHNSQITQTWFSISRYFHKLSPSCLSRRSFRSRMATVATSHSSAMCLLPSEIGSSFIFDEKSPK